MIDGGAPTVGRGGVQYGGGVPLGLGFLIKASLLLNEDGDSNQLFQVHHKAQTFAVLHHLQVLGALLSQDPQQELDHTQD